MKFIVINIYGPYNEQDPILGRLAIQIHIQFRGFDLGGDLNFSMGSAEVWGPRERSDPLAGFFSNMMGVKG
jgi:hypothetical protein